jgi:hypothetical protein
MKGKAHYCTRPTPAAPRRRFFPSAPTPPSPEPAKTGSLPLASWLQREHGDRPESRERFFEILVFADG